MKLVVVLSEHGGVLFTCQLANNKKMQQVPISNEFVQAVFRHWLIVPNCNKRNIYATLAVLELLH
jgi:hypothetical protein